MAKMHFRIATWALVSVAVLSSGCGTIGTPPGPVAFYDLGLIESAALPAAAVPAQIEVVAPSWIDVAQMQYRLQWDQPQRRRAYSDSRWVAQPAEMLGQALQRGLRGADEARSKCRLRVELDEFVQNFQSVGASTVDVVVRASLLAPRGVPAAHREFRVTRRAPTADAEGGVSAYRVAVGQLAGELGGWLAELDPEVRQGLNTGGRCGS